LFAPVHLLEAQVESTESELAGDRDPHESVGLFVSARSGPLRFPTRGDRESEANGARRFPLLVALSGNVRLESARSDFEILTGSLD